VGVTLRVEPRTVPVHATIHLDNEPRLGRNEVRDEPTDDHLPTKRDAQAPAAQRS
jgi:hypothetical protein